jgi:hypothetical protein
VETRAIDIFRDEDILPECRKAGSRSEKDHRVRRVLKHFTTSWLPQRRAGRKDRQDLSVLAPFAFYEGVLMEENEMQAMLIEYMEKGLPRQYHRHVQTGPLPLPVRRRHGRRRAAPGAARSNGAGGGVAEPGLIALLKHENPTIRGDALSVLGTIKARAARAAIEACLADTHPGVREAAEEALNALGGKG